MSRTVFTQNTEPRETAGSDLWLKVMHVSVSIFILEKKTFFVLRRQFFCESKSGAKIKKAVTIDHDFPEPKVTSRD